MNTIFNLPLKRVHLELTNICNFDCTFCPKHIMTRPYGIMEKGLAITLIDELVDYHICEKVTFHIMGEPLLHPDFEDILRYCNERGLKVGITTNGALLTNKMVSLLNKVIIDQINISFQTPDPESFRLRKAKGLDFYTYKTQVLDFINTLKFAHPNSKIKMHFLNTRFAGNLKRFMNGIEVIHNNRILRDTLKAWVEDIYGLPNLSHNHGLKKKVVSNLDSVIIYRWNVLEVYPGIYFETYHLDSWGNSFSKKEVVYKSNIGYCSGLGDHFGILWNGDFVLCCKDFDGNTVMGNVKEKGIMGMLKSNEVIRILDGFRRYRIVHSYCKICLGGSSFISSKLRQINSILLWKLLKRYFYYEKRLF